MNGVAVKYPQLKRTIAPKPERFRQLILSPERAQAELCRRSFFRFMIEFWEVICADTPYWNWHIPYLCGEAEKVAHRVGLGLPKLYDLLINIPPGTTKSTIFSIMFPPWCWTRWPWMRFIAGGYSASLSLEHAEMSREIVRSEKYRAFFPELEIKQDKDTKSNFKIVYRDTEGVRRLGGNRYSTSVGGTLTGFHAHILLVDDPLNPHQAVSKTFLDRANIWMDRTLSTRKIDKAVTPLILIQQRLHQNDPTGHILEKKKGNIRHICLPGECVTYEEEVRPRELLDNYVDGLLDPVRMPRAVLKEAEADLGQYGFSGQIGQRPTPPGGGMFQVDCFVVIDTLPAEVNFHRTLRYWDKAATADGGTWTVGVKMSRLKNGKFIIHDVKRGQWATNKREEIMRSVAEADGKQVIIYLEQEPGSGGKDSAKASISNLAGFMAIPHRPTGDKAYRADPYSVSVNNGDVMLLRGDWNFDFIEEHRFFPFSKYKDQVDASSGAYTKLLTGKVAMAIG